MKAFLKFSKATDEIFFKSSNPQPTTDPCDQAVAYLMLCATGTQYHSEWVVWGPLDTGLGTTVMSHCFKS